MKMASNTINLTSPILVDASSPEESSSASAVAQAIGALGEPESPAELAQRLAVVIAMMWSQVADADLFLPEKGRPLRGVRDARAGAGLLATLNAVWGPIAAQGLMPVTPTLLPRDLATGRGSTMSTPIFSGKSLEGFLVVQRQAEAPAFTIQNLEALVELAEGVGGILPLTRGRASASSASWLEQDMAAAGGVQRTFLPEPIGENSASVRVVTEYMPATEVSGPAELLERLNHTLVARMQDDRFVTALCVLLDAPNKRWIFANAGHVLPLLRRSTGVVSRVAYSSGPPLGIVAHAQYREETISVAAKDILLLATDGVFEILSAPRRPCSTMGQCQFTELVGSAPHDVGEISRRIVATAQEATNGRDDLALLGLQIAG